MKKILLSLFSLCLISISLIGVGCNATDRQNNPVSPADESVVSTVGDQSVIERETQAFLPPRVDHLLEGLSPEIVPGGEVILYRWRVVNNDGTYVLIKRFTVGIDISDYYPKSDDVDLGGFTLLRDGEDITRRTFVGKVIVSNDGSAGVSDVLSLAVKGINDIEAPLNKNYVVLESKPLEPGTGPWSGGVEVIPPYTIVEYTLKAKCGTGFSGRDEIETYLETDPFAKSDLDKTFLGDAYSIPGKAVVTLQSRRGIKEDWRASCFIYRIATLDDYGLCVSFDDLGGRPRRYQSFGWNNGFGTYSWPDGWYPMILRMPTEPFKRFANP